MPCVVGVVGIDKVVVVVDNKESGEKMELVTVRTFSVTLRMWAEVDISACKDNIYFTRQYKGIILFADTSPILMNFLEMIKDRVLNRDISI